jgi:hypothetical protein
MLGHRLGLTQGWVKFDVWVRIRFMVESGLILR